MTSRCVGLIFTLLCCLCTTLYPGKGKIYFSRISLVEELSQSAISSILQDRKGFMWFGTSDGLNKYNGYNFEVYSYDPKEPTSISSNEIYSICEDQFGNLWIGTIHGLNKFDPRNEQFTRYFHDPKKSSGLSQNKVICVYEDRSGNLWIGTRGGGLNKYNREKDRFIPFKHDTRDPSSLSHNFVNIIYEDKSGNLWIGTENGLNLFDRNRERFIHYKTDPNDPGSISHDNIQSLCEDFKGQLWVGTLGGGLNCLDRERGKFLNYKQEPGDPDSVNHNSITTIVEGKSGGIWIGTLGGGLNHFDPGTGKFTWYEHDPYDTKSISENVIYSIYRDRSDVYWIGTRSGAINKFYLEREKFELYQNRVEESNGLSSNVVFSIYEDRNEVCWVGTRGGLNKYDPEKGRFHLYVHESGDPYSLSNNNVKCILEDHTGILWVGTHEGGLNQFIREQEKFKHFQHNPGDNSSISSNTIYTIYEDRQLQLWIGTTAGLNKLDKKKGKFFSYQQSHNEPGSLSDEKVFVILEDSKANFWVGTSRGLDKLDRKDGTFYHYRNDPEDIKSICNDVIRCIFENKNGVLWIGTNGGLNRFNRKTETFTVYTESQGLPNNLIYGILEDKKGCLWISTNKGLSQFNPRTHEFKNYDVLDGLQGNEFNTGACFKDNKGKMYFGGINGLTAFYPESIIGNPYPPTIVITGFKKYNKKVKLLKSISEMEELRLSSEDYFFSLEYAALDYRSPMKNQYAHKLIGLDSDWVYMDSTVRMAQYTTLAYGTYTFKVRGSNNNGVWNEKGVSLKIIISPPLWQVWWFKALVALLISGLVFAWYKLWIRNIERQKEILENQVTERTDEINQQKEERTLLATAIEQADEIIVITDKNANIQYVNPAFERITGFNKEEVTGANPRILRSGEHTQEFYWEMWDTISRGEIWKGHFVNKKKNGALYEEEASIFPIRDANGLITNYVAVKRDVTDEIRLAKQLRQSQKMEAIGTLAGGIAHDFNNILGVIMGYTELSVDDLPEGSRTRENLQKILIASDRAKDLIKQILAFSRQNEIEKRPVEITPIVKESLKLIRSSLPSTIRITQEVRGIGRRVLADPTQIHQIIMNLCTNAAHAMQDTGGELNVGLGEVEVNKETSSLYKDVDYGLYLKLSVEDTGHGMEPLVVDRIFEPFFTTKKTGEGTGMGLAVLHGIVKSHGGEITVSSEPGKGSTFDVFLPWIQSKSEPRLKFSEPVPRGNECILLVDDEQDLVDMGQQMLERLGYKVVHTHSSLNAFEMFQERPGLFDLIITDLTMPEMTGIQLSRRILDIRKDIPIILTTGFSEKVNSESIKTIGIKEYVVKPLNKNDIAVAIRKALRKNSSDQ